MIHKKVLVFSLILGFLLTFIAWQTSEHLLTDLFGNFSYKLFKISYMETITQDQDGLTMRYLPGIGKVYDAEIIARQSSRGYDTRIDAERMKWFIQGSDWLLARIDSTAIITQPYDFSPASDQAPWISASAQSAGALAILKRAGQERDKDMLDTGVKMLKQLEPGSGKLSIAESDSSCWFVTHQSHPYSLYGMISVLTDLQEIFKITGLPLAGSLYLKGMRSLVTHLPELETNGYLNDQFLYLGRRSEHRKLYQMLGKLSEGYPDPLLSQRIKAYHRNHGSLVLWQLFVNPGAGRFIGFILVWLLFTLIAYFSLRRPVKNFTIDEG